MYAHPEVKAMLADKRPWRRVKMVDLVREWINASAENAALANKYAAISTNPKEPLFTPKAWHQVYEEFVESALLEPTFVTHLPSSIVPLAKSDGHGYALAFELIVNGQEIGCGYSEQNDPAEQLKVFKAQQTAAIAAAGGDLNATVGAMEDTKIDHDFLEALSVGMPPAGGLGIGIDRLVMWLTGAPSVRDVILFPTMRPQNAEA
jgi:lysyl-tRNA synthetase class 2